LDASGAVVGYDVALARRMAAAWGMELEIVATGFDGLVDALEAGKIDSIVSALPLDPRLTQDITYSPAYFDAGIFLVIAERDNGASITGPADLPGRTVAVEWGGGGDAVGRRLQRAQTPTPDGLPAITLLPLETQEDAVSALLAGEADAALIDGVTLRLAQGRGHPLQALGDALDSNPYVIASPIDAPLLGQQIAQTLASFQADGILETLEKEWFSP
jgi:ABC-type amino acid transport substrate-binding protein